jgi:hypothetical protein
MHSRLGQLVLGLLLGCAAEPPYATTTTTAAVIRHGRPRAPAPSASVVTQVPPHERSTAVATGAVLGSELALPVLVAVPPTPESVTLYHVLPPIDFPSNLPGTAVVISSLHGPVTTSLVVPHSRFAFWLLPFFPFGLSKAWGP